jgi:hypothetical protein
MDDFFTLNSSLSPARFFIETEMVRYLNSIKDGDKPIDITEAHEGFREYLRKEFANRYLIVAGHSFRLISILEDPSLVTPLFRAFCEVASVRGYNIYNRPKFELALPYEDDNDEYYE